jgi:hypothetical protein
VRSSNFEWIVQQEKILETEKGRATRAENYPRAKKCKALLEDVDRAKSDVERLELKKREAVEDDNYDEANALKKRINDIIDPLKKEIKRLLDGQDDRPTTRDSTVDEKTSKMIIKTDKIVLPNLDSDDEDSKPVARSRMASSKPPPSRDIIVHKEHNAAEPIKRGGKAEVVIVYVGSRNKRAFRTTSSSSSMSRAPATIHCSNVTTRSWARPCVLLDWVQFKSCTRRNGKTARRPSRRSNRR